MSYPIGMDTIHLRPTPRVAHTEYCSNAALRRALKSEGGWGRDAASPQSPSMEDLWECDLIWSTHDGIDWAQRGRVTDMGHADFLEGGTDRRMPQTSPFKDVDEVLAFDAVKEYGLEDGDSLTRLYQDWHDRNQALNPNQVWTAGHYKTIVSGAIQAFGWDLLLEAAAYRAEFEKVLDSIFRLSLHHYRAWSRTKAPVFISHDDFVWSQGAFIHPDFYRRVIIPRYKELWSVLKDSGKRVLFCSDANWIEFVDDVAEAGADGFIFEPMMPLDPVVERYGRTHVIVGSKSDCRTLTFGTKEQIAAEIDATLELARDCPGFMYAVGNHIPSNVPLENAQFYIDHLRSRWSRRAPAIARPVARRATATAS